VQKLEQAPKVDGVILSVAHDIFKNISLGRLSAIMNTNPVLIDVQGLFEREKAERNNFYYRTL